MAEPAPGPTGSEDKLTAFKRFEDLTRRMIAVPKSEVDALRKKQEQARARKRK
jgi:hypothetical protein